MGSTDISNFRLVDWLPAWLSPDDLIGFLAASAILIAFVAVFQELRSRDPYSRRVSEVAQRRAALRRTALDTRRQRPRMTAQGLMSQVAARFNLLRSQRAHDARNMLAQAGMRSDEAMIRYLITKFVGPIGLGLLILLDNWGPQMLPIPEGLRTFAPIAGVLIGWFGPDVLIRNKIAKRAHRMELGLPDALDLLVICAEAGLSLDASLVRVSRELEATWPELSEEFGITAAELTYLPDRKQAFDNLNARTNMAAVRGVVNTLLQTAKFGTPLAQSLRILAAEYREARITRAEEKAARLPAMLTVPMILFILPTLFIVLLGPAILSIMDTFSGKK